MPVDPINNYVLPPAPTAKKNYLDQGAFLQLLSVQLSTQNPLEPMSDRDFFAQLAQLGTVQGVDELKRSIQSSQAASLLGKKVVVATADASNSVVTGTVEAVQMSDQKVYVKVEGNFYEMNKIVQILQ